MSGTDGETHDGTNGRVEYLRNVYDLATQADTDAYYTQWAASYDDELTRQGYQTPRRCADALRRFVASDATVLDIGCGTGLSGAALASAGLTDLVGTDVNAEMLDVARVAGIYRDTWVTDIDDPFPFARGTYNAIAAVGVIGVGAAPASLLRQSLEALAADGRLVFSYNDHALEVPEFTDALTDVISSGLAEQEFAEHGTHIEGLGSMSTVYVLRRC
ncbi:class I SAM-dependent DNA methyltransferase [Ilumatobacter sp.]|uniref:class I SAM-dependent DNA methyltransferase n=1 Tax=Ilumatobacter sp. TaxID=1967498 RepID=UPI003751C560